jgi:hypothetical protein
MILEENFDFSELGLIQEERPELMTKQELKKLKKKRVKDSKSLCSVCHEAYRKGEVIRVLPCTHVFHYKCLKPWFKKSNACPVCRLDVKQRLQELVNEEERLREQERPEPPEEPGENNFLLRNLHNNLEEREQNKDEVVELDGDAGVEEEENREGAEEHNLNIEEALFLTSQISEKEAKIKNNKRKLKIKKNFGVHQTRYLLEEHSFFSGSEVMNTLLKGGENRRCRMECEVSMKSFMDSKLNQSFDQVEIASFGNFSAIPHK